MTLSPYPEYKDSGVNWLSQVPGHWGVKRGKFVFRTLKEINSQLQCNDRLALTMKGVIERSTEDVEGLQPADFMTYQVVEKDDLIFKLIDLQNIKTSRVGLIPKRGIVSPAYIRIMRTAVVSVAYMFQYYFFLYRNNIFNELGGSGVRSAINAGDLLDISVLVPPINEQETIAAFLDHETARIDGLIAKQERLIELLKEKRQAVISHAVTKGLNPDAPMKDSGVDWLGQVPEHWDVLQLKRMLSDIVYGTSESSNDDGEYEVLGMGDIQGGKVLFPGLRFLDDIPRELLIEQGDILFNRTNSLALVGKCGLVESDAVATFASYLVRFRTTPNALSAYLNYLLNIDSVLAQARGMALPSISQANLNPNRYGYIHLCCPPIDEQEDIIGFLAKETEGFRALIEKAESAIELMKEHRTALISAAVTGKIDVRGWRAPEQKAEAMTAA